VAERVDCDWSVPLADDGAFMEIRLDSIRRRASANR